MRGATTVVTVQFLHTIIISIHAPHAGRDNNLLINNRIRKISIHAPHAGRDTPEEIDAQVASIISIHAPHAGRDQFIYSVKC